MNGITVLAEISDTADRRSPAGGLKIEWSSYRRCGYAGLCSVSLPVLEQKELSVCVIFKKVPLSGKKKMGLALIDLYKKRTFFFVN